ncbi:MAG: hypothetical protein H6908_05860 [Hyphomicrobiales bacterium]|nr:hypothetical protein [Rickettsiales bacterium]MCP5362138.1 hypothetical protein [Hyphomicrobiales bacterium]
MDAHAFGTQLEALREIFKEYRNMRQEAVQRVLNNLKCGLDRVHHNAMQLGQKGQPNYDALVGVEGGIIGNAINMSGVITDKINISQVRHVAVILKNPDMIVNQAALILNGERDPLPLTRDDTAALHDFADKLLEIAGEQGIDLKAISALLSQYAFGLENKQSAQKHAIRGDAGFAAGRF